MSATAPALAITLNPGSWVAWILIGLIAGAVAGRLVRGKGYGCLLDIVVGIVGAFVGGFIVNLLTNGTTAFGFLGSLVVAILGAVVLLAFIRLI